MTPQAATLIVQKAQHQIDGKWCYTHITADELRDLARAYLDALQRLDTIAELAEDDDIRDLCDYRT